MKFTLSWLKDYLETDASLTELCDKLTAIGLEVEGVEDQSAALKSFTIAEILKVEDHPQADKLHICTVNTGAEVLQIVCGAPNARAGLKTVLARPGDVIPVNGEKLKLSKIRGVESQGMMCSGRELGLSEDHVGIMDLPADAPVGGNFAAYAKLGDAVIEINLTPNRGDCAGVLGVARDLAAAGMGRLIPPAIKPVPEAGVSPIGIKLDFPAGQEKACPHFVGRLIRNIQNRPSPDWMQARLRAIGLRPISALVDITNYLSIDCARPLHVFDADKIKGSLIVSAAKGGETFEALNGKPYTLEPGMTIISDESGAVLSLAGVMGGASSGWSEETKNVFVESAFFDPQRTTQTGRALQLNSDARYRFERGVDPAFVEPGADLAAQLVLDFCKTPETICSARVVAGAPALQPRVVELRLNRCQTLVGVEVAPEEQIKILKALGFDPQREGEKLVVGVPSWRPDIDGEADLVEEVIRIKGFDAIPATSLERPTALPAPAIDKMDRRAGLARRTLATRGLFECVTWAFMSSKVAEAFGPIDPLLRLQNPISSDLDVMRGSILGNLIQAAARNAARGFADVGLFEVGVVYQNMSPSGQKQVAAFLRAGTTPRGWAEASRPVDAFDAKADVLAALTAMGVPLASLQVSADAPSYYHPGRSGCFRLGATVLASFGELNPAVLDVCEASGPMVGGEIFIEALPLPRKETTARPLLKLEPLQPVSRDFAFLVGRDVSSDKLLKAIRSADKKLIVAAEVFDVYEGERIAPDQKSIAICVTLQPTEATLTDADMETLTAHVTEAARKAVGAVLRG